MVIVHINVHHQPLKIINNSCVRNVNKDVYHAHQLYHVSNVINLIIIHLSMSNALNYHAPYICIIMNKRIDVWMIVGN